MELKTTEILAAAKSLNSVENILNQKLFTIGFDGFVDEIIHPVSVRKNKLEYERIETISEFSALIGTAAGKSANIEMVPVQVKMGGNGPLMSMTVASLGGQVNCIGLLGHPNIHAVFMPLCEKAKVISVGNPGHTDALEFKDGKLMLGKLNTISEMCWKRIQEIVGIEKFKNLLEHSDLVACTNWTMVTEFGEILDQVIELVQNDSRVIFFFDLADPQKRDPKDLEKLLKQIQSLNKKARCILGLNLSEAEQVSAVLGIKTELKESPEGLEAASINLAKVMGLYGVVVHAIRSAGASVNGESSGVSGPYCPSPRLSTGAGDHFNGGTVSGLIAGLSVRDALYFGVGTSGWYVRNAKSPSTGDVVKLLKDWAEGKSLD